ncbi:MAG: sigma-70 family RNA polymerase sigma factor [Planctomycetes bacterium]|nr:sigma-70 family RNA polymerase sigma factor [Planctomycetota bacterium]
MTVTYAPDITDYFTTQLIRRTANSLVETGIFPQSDLDDVIQELRLCLLTQVPNFNPSKARWSTFVKHVVRMSAISLRRRQNAECRRGARQVGSLNVLVDGPFGAHTQLGAMVSEEEHRTGVGQGFISHADQIDLSEDVRTVIDSLPAALKQICERLAFQTPTEVRRELGLPRSTMQRRLESLRKHFRAAGISDFV